MENEDELLYTPIRDLPVSENFYLRSKLMGYRTIAEVLAGTGGSIWANEEFTYGWLSELIALLTAHKLVYRLQPMPGSTGC